MQLLSSPARAFKGRATGWHIQFPKLLLVAFLVAGALLALLAPSAAEAKAGPISTQPIQISQLNMIDQQHGWAFSSTLRTERALASMVRASMFSIPPVRLG